MELSLPVRPMTRRRSTSVVRRQSLCVDLGAMKLDFVGGADPYDDLALPVAEVSGARVAVARLRGPLLRLTAALESRADEQGRGWYDANDLRDELDALLRSAIPGRQRRLFAALVADLATTLGTRAFSEIDWNEVLAPSGSASKSELLALSALRIAQGRYREAQGLLELIRRRSGVWSPLGCLARFEQMCTFASR